MDRDGVGNLGRADDRRHVEIGKRRLRRSDAHGFVGEEHVLGVEIGGRMNCHGLDPECAARAQNTKGDLAPVGDDDFFDHQDYSMVKSG